MRIDGALSKRNDARLSYASVEKVVTLEVVRFRILYEEF